jgi:putative intracellular protease/amidase
MKITTFDPMIISKNADDVISVFEDLGFSKTHAPVTKTEAGEVPSYRMKHENGYHVDVADLKIVPQDITYIRMNVDNFAEAYDILVAHGFKNTRGDGSVETKSSKAATMVSPSGFTISLIEHKKDHD